MKLVKNEKSVKEPKLNKKEQKAYEDFKAKFDKHKKEYIKKFTIAEMVYENGSATAMLYKEVQKLNSLVLTLINKDNGEFNKKQVESKSPKS